MYNLGQCNNAAKDDAYQNRYLQPSYHAWWYDRVLVVSAKLCVRRISNEKVFY
jgi:hypothetical protein